MSAFGGSGSGSASGVASLLGTQATSGANDDELDEKAKRVQQLEREVSNLTNSNLKLQE